MDGNVWRRRSERLLSGAMPAAGLLEPTLRPSAPRQSPDRAHTPQGLSSRLRRAVPHRDTAAPRVGRPPAYVPRRRIDRTLSIDRGVGFVLAGFLVLATKAMLSAGIYIPWISPLCGMAVVAGVPTFLLYSADVVRLRSKTERLAVSVVLALGLVMAAGLLINTLLPHKQVPRPLSGETVMLIVEGVCAALGVWAWRRHPPVYRVTLPHLGIRDVVLCGLTALVLVMAVTGAIRLNNGAGGGLTLSMLVVTLATLSLLVTWRERVHPGVIPTVIFGVSLGLLLMTSLRGWYTTGHDIQTEYLVFQLTKTLARWKTSTFPDAYNACLSITILPTMIWRWTRVADPYVFKVFFQVLFAFCPVLVYRLATRLAPRGVALLATILFISFVTFFQDMPMLNRQEIAFLFLVAGLVVVANDQLSVRTRQLWFAVFAVGMALSHYSTTYVAIGVLGVGLGLRVAMVPARRVIGRIAPALAARVAPVTQQRERYVLGAGVLVFVAAISFAWGAPLTHTSQGLATTLKAAAASVRWDAIVGSKSSDTSYSILAASKKSPDAVLADYRAAIVKATAGDRTGSGYYGLDTVEHYPAPLAPDPRLPLTGVGRGLSSLGLNLPSINYGVRQASAKLLQVLIVIGLLTVLLARRKRIHPRPEFFFLGAASLLTVILQVLLPPLSLNYGLLRSFEQALVLLSVFFVGGAMALVPRAFPRTGFAVAAVVVLAFFASSTGILTQAVGGYGPQLHLNNAGEYYDLYYTHAEEVAAIGWLNTTAVGPGGQRAIVEMDPGTRARLQALTHLDIAPDIYPLLVKRDAFVLLSYANLRAGTAPALSSVAVVGYDYPVSFLDTNKDLLYASGGARVYK